MSARTATARTGSRHAPYADSVSPDTGSKQPARQSVAATGVPQPCCQ